MSNLKGLYSAGLVALCNGLIHLPYLLRCEPKLVLKQNKAFQSTMSEKPGPCSAHC